MSEKIYIGVAWPYANGSLHLGQIAGAYLPADIFARYHRIKGNEVLMVSGSDQHGTPITINHKEDGKLSLTLIQTAKTVLTRLSGRVHKDWTAKIICFTDTPFQVSVALSFLASFMV